MRQIVRSAAVVMALAALGCGGDEEPVASVAPMAPAASKAERPGNRAPVIERVAFEPEEPGALESVRAVVKASDPEGDPVSLGFAWQVNGHTIDQGGPVVTLPQTRKGDVISVRVTASDGSLESLPQEASTRVRNRAPRLGGMRIEPAGGIHTGVPVTVRPSAEDADGDAVEFEYRWSVNGRSLDEQGPVLDTSGLRRGDVLRVEVTATDGSDESETLASPDITIANASPVIVSKPAGSGPDGVFRYLVFAVDADNDRLRFVLGSAPDGMTFAACSGEIEWTPRPDQEGVHPIEVVVEDLRGGRGSQTFELTIGVTETGGIEGQPAAPAPTP